MRETPGTETTPSGYRVRISHFDGPLDLLWHLIHETKIDIFDIPISVITRDYLAYMHDVQELTLADATDFYNTATKLISIKSRLLLNDPIDEHQEDPREELVAQLIEYQRIKKLARALTENTNPDARALARAGALGNRVARFKAVAAPSQFNIPLKPHSASVLAYTIRKMSARLIGKLFTFTHPPDIEKIIQRVVHLVQKGAVQFKALLGTRGDSAPMPECVHTFNAVLFAASQRLISVLQKHPFAALWIRPRE